MFTIFETHLFPLCGEKQRNSNTWQILSCLTLANSRNTKHALLHVMRKFISTFCFASQQQPGRMSGWLESISPDNENQNNKIEKHNFKMKWT